jgi:hypothetical protein
VPYSCVFAVEFRIADADQVWPAMQRHRDYLIALGTQYAVLYRSIEEAERVLITLGIRTATPLKTLLQSRSLFDWFDAMGIDDIPAMFAGESVERFDVSPHTAPPTPDVVVAAIAPVDDVDAFVTYVRRSLDQFRAQTIRKALIYRAFDNPHEILFIQELARAEVAQSWLKRSAVADKWLAEAGMGAYPPLFVGRFENMLQLADTAGGAGR